MEILLVKKKNDSRKRSFKYKKKIILKKIINETSRLIYYGNDR